MNNNYIIFVKRGNEMYSKMIEVQFEKLKKVYFNKFEFIKLNECELDRFSIPICYYGSEIIIIKSNKVIKNINGFRQFNNYINLLESVL